jgi:hypothetical protein
MIEVDCFCGCVYSFSGDVGACPGCGECATFPRVTTAEARQMRSELDAVINRPGTPTVTEATLPEFVLERAERGVGGRRSSMR